MKSLSSAGLPDLHAVARLLYLLINTASCNEKRGFRPALDFPASHNDRFVDKIPFRHDNVTLVAVSVFPLKKPSFNAFEEK